MPRIGRGFVAALSAAATPLLLPRAARATASSATVATAASAVRRAIVAASQNFLEDSDPASDLILTRL